MTIIQMKVKINESQRKWKTIPDKFIFVEIKQWTLQSAFS